MKQRRESLDEQYVFFSPIGSTIKRKEREINITEQSYLSILHGLNSARLKQKSLQMSSATLKIINPPAYPISAMPTKEQTDSHRFVFRHHIVRDRFLHADRTARPHAQGQTEDRTYHRRQGTRRIPRTGTPQIQKLYQSMQRSGLKIYGQRHTRIHIARQTDIVNVMSMERGEGKSFITEKNGRISAF